LTISSSSVGDLDSRVGARSRDGRNVSRISGIAVKSDTSGDVAQNRLDVVITDSDGLRASGRTRSPSTGNGLDDTSWGGASSGGDLIRALGDGTSCSTTGRDGSISEGSSRGILTASNGGGSGASENTSVNNEEKVDSSRGLRNSSSVGTVAKISRIGADGVGSSLKTVERVSTVSRGSGGLGCSSTARRSREQLNSNSVLGSRGRTLAVAVIESSTRDLDQVRNIVTDHEERLIPVQTSNQLNFDGIDVAQVTGLREISAGQTSSGRRTLGLFEFRQRNVEVLSVDGGSLGVSVDVSVSTAVIARIRRSGIQENSEVGEGQISSSSDGESCGASQVQVQSSGRDTASGVIIATTNRGNKTVVTNKGRGSALNGRVGQVQTRGGSTTVGNGDLSSRVGRSSSSSSAISNDFSSRTSGGSDVEITSTTKNVVINSGGRLRKKTTLGIIN